MNLKNNLIKIIVSTTVFFILLVAIFKYNTSKIKSEQVAEVVELETAQPALTTEEIDDLVDSYKVLDEVIETTEGTEATEVVEIPIDFEGLHEVNADVYAWISIPGTVIDYPILQHASDDSYYLNYNIDGSYGYPGCIYTEKVNAKDFSDPNTIIYGHNMKDDSMFGMLHSYKDSLFFGENPLITIYTETEILTYQIFAAYEYDAIHLMYSFNFWDESVFETYLDDIFNIRDMSVNIDKNLEVTIEDTIITLSTCTDDNTRRMLVQAVLIETCKGY
ncbi:MAG: class B sortase [Lachnospiraceae bacterium]